MLTLNIDMPCSQIISGVKQSAYRPLLMHTIFGYQLIPKPMTLDYLQLSLCILIQNTRASEHITKI